MLLNETQAIRDFKQGQHYANADIRELDDYVANFRQLQGNIQVRELDDRRIVCVCVCT